MLSRRIPTAAAWVWSQVSSCGIYGGQSDSGACFLGVLRFRLPILIPTNAPYAPIIRGWYNRPINGQRTNWTQPHPIPRNKKENGRGSSLHKTVISLPALLMANNVALESEKKSFPWIATAERLRLHPHSVTSHWNWPLHRRSNRKWRNGPFEERFKNTNDNTDSITRDGIGRDKTVRVNGRAMCPVSFS
jgi:hypothetical protein